MSKAWKAGVMALVVFALVWLVTMWRWQTRGVDVGGTDIVTHLLVLPLLLLLTLWGAQKVASHVRSAPATTAAPATTIQGAQGAGSAAGSDDALRCFGAAVVDARVCLLAGESARDVALQVRERQVWPTLDETLQDVDGNPVFTARVQDLEMASDHESALPESVARAQSLLRRVWRPLTSRLVEWRDSPVIQHALGCVADSEPESASSPRPAHLAGLASQRPAAPGAQPRLTFTVLVALPGHWSADERERILASLQAGLPEHLQASDAGVSWQWRVLAVEEPETLWSQVDQILLSWARSGEPASLLLLTADSALGEDAVGLRQARGELFTALHQQGRIPGEGAAALWLASPAWPGLNALDPPPARLHRPQMGRRDKSADALGRVGGTVLQALLRGALAVPAVPEQRVAQAIRVVSDGDHRASRTSELYESLTEVLPDLDPTVSVCRLGDSCGDLGLAGALAPVALAAGLLMDAPADAEDPAVWPLVLAACVQSPWQRVVLALSPWSAASTARH